MTITTQLADIQHKMRAPKDKDNNFGGYKYRNAEGILAAFKSLRVSDSTLVCTDTVSEVGGQIFVTATARLTIGGETVEAQGHAMHPLQKKGMDASQITGSASSYARKYALCGLFAIEDESQDPDSRDNREERGQTPAPPHPEAIETAKDSLSSADSMDRLKAIFTDLPPAIKAHADVIAAKDARKAVLHNDAEQPQNADLGGDQIPY